MEATMKLVIGYDGSRCAQQAIADLQSAGLPEVVRAKVVCVADVWLPPLPSEAEAALPLPVAKGRALAKLAVEEAYATAREGGELLARYFPKWTIETESHADSPAWGLLQIAKEWDADLLVVGSHGRSPLGRLVLGSVSQKVATEAHCSVRIARERPEPERPQLRIVLGFDGSPDAEAALQTVAGRRWPAGTEVVVVAVMEPRSVSDLAAEQSPLRAWVQPGDTDARQAFERVLQSATTRLASSHTLVTPVLLEGDAKRVLLEEAKSRAADCIFVGARGLNFLERFLLGSVSAAVAARAHCTVEIVRPRQAKP
jgi:nucleotide-binding universal stress UspA family protein